ncbi:type I 3-dehydroquinate dehydratase [Ligilactobacillus sp. LYQ139]|uniref:type I 3-dehydroquinate dehydratase n=1 Tax=Ligilactobacillus sp. LYQ139 TaxID=3378800 RepID=UPI0038519484
MAVFDKLITNFGGMFMGRKAVRVRDIVLGSGQPKIAVPVCGTDDATVIAQAQRCMEKQPDVIEWRVDYYRNNERSTLTRIAQQLRQIIGNTVLLATFRTKAEGGERHLEEDEYFAICDSLLATGAVDLLDVELMHDPHKVKAVVGYAHQKGVAVVMSNHDFAKTPARSVIINRLAQMESMGADIAKIAVMPQNMQDVLLLMTATEEAYRHLEIPVISMAMGDDGRISRCTGELTGSCLSFAAVAESSAPGQMTIDDLRLVLSTVHSKTKGEK